MYTNNFLFGKGFEDKIKDSSIENILKAFFFKGKYTHVAMIVTPDT